MQVKLLTCITSFLYADVNNFIISCKLQVKILICNTNCASIIYKYRRFYKNYYTKLDSRLCYTNVVLSKLGVFLRVRATCTVFRDVKIARARTRAWSMLRFYSFFSFFDSAGSGEQKSRALRVRLSLSLDTSGSELESLAAPNSG